MLLRPWGVGNASGKGLRVQAACAGSGHAVVLRLSACSAANNQARWCFDVADPTCKVCGCPHPR
jgi:hypothetical protein